MILQKISREEAENLSTQTLGKMHPVRAAILDLAVGEILQIPESEFEWKGKTPQIFCTQISKKSKKRFKTSRLLNHTGWLVERLG